MAAILSRGQSVKRVKCVVVTIDNNLTSLSCYPSRYIRLPPKAGYQNTVRCRYNAVNDCIVLSDQESWRGVTLDFLVKLSIVNYFGNSKA